MPSTCPSCKSPATGRYCSSCGADLEQRVPCASCGNELPVGGRFCNRCGEPTAAAREAAPRTAQGLPAGALWGIGGVVVGALIVALVLAATGGDEAPPAAPFATGATAPAAGDPAAVDLSAMTPREAADRLYTRVMTLVESGDSAQARTFLPMALAAYQRVEELDADARYHLGVLHLFAGDPASTQAQSDTILAAAPDHLFGIYNSAAARQALGDPAGARSLFQRFLDLYDAEVAKALPEYQAHQPVLTVMRQEASRAVDSL